MDQLGAQLRELHALASEGILDAQEYAQLKADAITAHRQWHRRTHDDKIQLQARHLLFIIVNNAPTTF